MSFEQGKLILYQAEDGTAAVEVRLEDETVWLTLAQITDAGLQKSRQTDQ